MYMEMLNLQDSINQLSFGNPKENERVQTLLFKEGISTIGKLCRLTKADLQSIEKIGDITIERIINNLEKCGLHLGMTEFECSTYNRCRSRILQSRENFVNEIERMLEEEKDNIRFIDRDLTPEDFENEQEFEDDGECCHHIAFNIHNNLQLPKKEAEPIDWDARFYDIAKEEFLRQNRMFSCEEIRAEKAVAAASAFIEAMKAHQSKEKSN